MTHRTYPMLAAVACLAALAGGCAKKEMVKPEQPVAPAASTAPAEPSAPVAVAPQPKVEVPVEQPIRQEPVKEASAAAPVETAPAVDLKKELETIYFNFDSSLLSEEARSSLAKGAAFLQKNKGIRIQIEGHCDERGSDEYNLALGERRAQAALKYLATMGVPAERLSVISYGKEKPANPGHDETAWQKNRRDEFVVSGK